MVTKNSQRKFEFIAGNLALDFANTVHNMGGKYPDDDLVTFGDVVAWGRQAGLITDQSTPGGEAELKRLKDLRAAIYQLFSGLLRDGKPQPKSLARFNRHLHASLDQARLQRGKNAYRLISQSHRLTDYMHFEITQAAIQLLLSGQYERLRQCAGEQCSWLFVDSSRNSRRRWCDMQACGNRAKIRRFRERLKS